MKKTIKNSILLNILAWIAFVVAFSGLATILWQLIPNHNSLMGMKILQLLQTIFVLLLPAVILVYYSSDESISNYLYINKKPILRMALLAVSIALVAQPLINYLSYLNHQLELPEAFAKWQLWIEQQEQQLEMLTERFVRADTIGELLFNIVLMALMPAIAEEVTFRGWLLRLFNKNSTTFSHLSIWLTAIIFSAIHLQFLGFIPRMLLGALLGYAFKWTKNLWIPILIHFTNNCFAVMAYFICNKNGWDIENVEQIGVGNMVWITILSLLLTSASIYLLHKETNKNSFVL